MLGFLFQSYHNEIVSQLFLNRGKSTVATLALSSNFPPSLFFVSSSQIHTSPPEPLVSWWGDPDVNAEGDGQEKERERNTKIELPFMRDFIVQHPMVMAFTQIDTNNDVDQTMKSIWTTRPR